MLFIVEHLDTEAGARIAARFTETGDHDIPNVGDFLSAYAEQELKLSTYSLRLSAASDWHSFTSREMSKIYTRAAGQDPAALFPTLEGARAGVASLLSNATILAGIPEVPENWMPAAEVAPQVVEPPIPVMVDEAPAPVPVDAMSAPTPQLAPVVDEVPTPPVVAEIEVAEIEADAPQTKGPNHPKPKTKGAEIWAIFDACAADPDRAYLSRQAYIEFSVAAGYGEPTCVTQYGLWRTYKQYHGLWDAIEGTRQEHAGNILSEKNAKKAVQRTAAALAKAQRKSDDAIAHLATFEKKDDSKAALHVVSK
jgi:hypothetical protein